SSSDERLARDCPPPPWLGRAGVTGRSTSIRILAMSSTLARRACRCPGKAAQPSRPTTTRRGGCESSHWRNVVPPPSRGRVREGGKNSASENVEVSNEVRPPSLTLP